MPRHHVLNIIFLIADSPVPHADLLDAFFLESRQVGAICVAMLHELCESVAFFVGGDDSDSAEWERIHSEGEVEGFVFDEAVGVGPVALAGPDDGDGGSRDGVGEVGVVGDGGGEEHSFSFFFVGWLVKF